MAKNVRTNYIINKVKTSNPSLYNKLIRLEIPNINAYIEQGYLAGDFRQYGLKDSDVQKINSELQPIIQSISDKEINQSTIEQTDEANLTQEELQNRIEAFQGLSEQQGTRKELNIPEAKRIVSAIITQVFGQNNMGTPDPNGLQALSDYTADVFLNVKPFSPQVFAERYKDTVGGLSGGNFENLKGIAEQVHNAVIPQRASLYTYTDVPIPGTDTSADVTRVQDQLNAMIKKGSSQKEIDDFLSALPETLKASREELIKGETGRALESFQETIPRSLEQLNVRGALFSGDVGDLLTQQGLNVEGALNEFASTLEQQDYDFYFNAAYQKKIQDLLESSQNLAQDLAAKRGEALTTQKQGWTSAQTDLNTKLTNELTLSDYERRLQLRRAELQAQKDREEKARQYQLVGNIGNIVGTTVGTIAGARIGSSGTSQNATVSE